MDFLLIGTTLLLGLIGTVWKDPPYRAKIALIVLLFVSGGLSVLKSIGDEHDKVFLQNLTVSGLTLPNAAYAEVFKPLNRWLRADGYDNGFNCHHTPDGMSCVVGPTPTKQKLVFVLNRFEVAEVYANGLRGKSNSALIGELVRKEYKPSNLSEEFKDKLGILGVGLFYDMCSRFPTGYDFDDKFGVTITFEDGGAVKTINLSPAEIVAVPPGRNAELFPAFVRLLEPKIQAKAQHCGATPG
jgi:hypothetical protein